MLKAYKIYLTETPDGYVVYVPDFKCNTQGKDIAEALFMARDVIGMMAMCLADDGETIPEPNSIPYQKEENEIETYVDVDLEAYRKKHDNRKVKKTLSIPSWLNELAEAENVNFSRLLEDALREKLDPMESP